MNALWDRFKWLFTHASWVLAALIVAIDPKHIDKLAEQHPLWSGIIIAAWAMLMAWANKTKPQPPETYPGQNAASAADRRGQPPSQKPYTGGLR